MRPFFLMLGCAALVLAAPASADQHRYTVNFHFAKSDTNRDTFARDRSLCVRQTSGAMPTGGTFMGARDGNWGAGEIYKYNADGFYNCMTAKGYRTDPNGPFAVSFQVWL